MSQSATTDNKAEKVERPKIAKGRRPYFFDDPNIDKVMAIVMAVAGEVSVIRERLDTHERLAEDKKWPSFDEVEQFKGDDDINKWRDEWRAEYLNRVLRIITEELERLKRPVKDKDYDEIVEEVKS